MLRRQYVLVAWSQFESSNDDTWINMEAKMIKFKVYWMSVYFAEGPRMSFCVGRTCPLVSQTWCDTPPLYGERIHLLNLLFCFGGGGADGEHYFSTILRGSSWKVWFADMSQWILRGSSTEEKVLSSVVVCGVSQPLIKLRFMGRVEIVSGSDGSGDWGLWFLSSVVGSACITAIFAILLKGWGRFRSFRLVRSMGSCLP